MNDSTGVDHRGAFAFFALCAGVLSLVLFVFPIVYAPHPPADLLPFFERHRPIYLFTAIAILVWVIAAIPTVAAWEGLLGAGGRSLARAAALSSAAGVALVGFAVFAFVGALLAIAAAGGAAPSPAAPAYQAAIWSNLSFFLADPGLMILGLGQFLFAWLAWQSGTFGRAVSGIGIVGGVAGLLTLATYQTSILAMVQFGAFGLWAIVTGIVLLRSRANAPLYRD